MSRRQRRPLRSLWSGLGRAAWISAGLLAVALGGLGVIVPGLPSTVFFLAAAWCFARSSERLERWVLGLPGVGPMVRDARAGLGMPRRTKASAITIMWTAIVVSAVIARDRTALVAVVVVLGLVGTACILFAVPTRERVLEQRATSGH
ncbi:MAG: YbaN family protein [Actinomycetota bacterium]